MPSSPTSTDGVATWNVRRERPSDEAQVHDVVTAAFDDPAVASLLADMRRDHCWLGLSFVAEHPERPGHVVGHVAYTRGWVDAPHRLIDVLVLSPLSVRPEVQRQGVGRQLLHRSLELLRGRPEPVVFLEGDPGYYGSSGFQPAGDLGFHRPSARIPPAAFQAWQLPTYDTGLSGPLVYPDIFWRHDAVGLRD
ncbi:GNAT family N-acetyltransferase [Georgenia subflava]|uniref:GNAT family N-acetyltransferase n=1 Tax=Georgenia subflava TaxID=1622177 RepID=A0A6N7EJB3_9MICO|nr:N-acetyltransferase [Georgenia subflava]MPV37143.1 GNAT family N-acetyltransferase [Georgenia subflava]